MKVSITYLELTSIFKLFQCITLVRKIGAQLKQSNCLASKKNGFWKSYYTMTLWQNEQDIRFFVGGGAHLEAMKQSIHMTKITKAKTIDADNLLSWKQAKSILFD